MTLTELKKSLNAMEKSELIALICKMYKGSRQAKDLVDVELGGADVEEGLIGESKEKIRNCFFGRKFSLRNAKCVITDFKKISKKKENVAELMLYYVECGVEFTNTFGDVDDRFYYSVAAMFENFVDQVNALKDDTYYESQKARIRKVVDDSDGIGWGFSDDMQRIYYDAFPESDT